MNDAKQLEEKIRRLQGMVSILQRDFNEQGEIIRRYREGIELTEVFGIVGLMPQVYGNSLQVSFVTGGARDEFIKKLNATVKVTES